VGEQFVAISCVVGGFPTWSRRSLGSHATRSLRSPSSVESDGSKETAKESLRTASVLPWYLWPLLLSIDTIGSFSSDSYLPNILQIKEQFNASTTMVTLTLQLNWITAALAAAAVGVLADRYGRRLVLIACFGIYVAATALAATSTSIYVLVAARVLMGLGQGSQVMAQVIARDLIDDISTRLRVMAVLGSLQPLVLVTAPIIGGSIGSFLGWRWVFWLQAAWGALAGLGCMAMREPQRAVAAGGSGKEGDAQDSGSPSLCTTVCRLLTSRVYVGAVGLCGIMLSAIAAMLTLLPFALQSCYHLGETATGGLIGAVPTFMIAGSAVATLASRHLGPVTILRITMLPFLALGIVTLLLAAFYSKSASIGIPVAAWWPLLLPCCLMTAMNGVLVPVCQTLSLHAFKDMAGAAAGASGFVQTLMMSAGSAVASAAWDGTPRSFFATLAVLMLGAQLWFWLTLGVCPPPLEPNALAEGDGVSCGGEACSSRATAAAEADSADLEAGSSEGEKAEGEVVKEATA